MTTRGRNARPTPNPFIAMTTRGRNARPNPNPYIAMTTRGRNIRPTFEPYNKGSMIVISPITDST